jgi:hypothetical protein
MHSRIITENKLIKYTLSKNIQYDPTCLEIDLFIEPKNPKITKLHSVYAKHSH